MSGVSRKRHRRPLVVGPQLQPLSLATPVITENAAPGTAVGAIYGRASGSLLSLLDNAGGRFALSGANLVAGAVGTDREVAASHTVIVRETLAGYGNSPRDTVLTISVSNVFEAPTLAELSLSSISFAAGSPGAGSIIGATSGSTIAASGLPTGLTINGAARTWVWDGSGAVGSAAVTLTETLSDSVNSPRATTIPITIGAPVTRLLADNGDQLVNDNSNPLTLEAA